MLYADKLSSRPIYIRPASADDFRRLIYRPDDYTREIR